MYCCGPAPVKAIRSKRTDIPYDVPFVYAEVNADVHTIIVSQGQVLSVNKDTERVGSLICTKAVGFPRLENITGNYKYESMAPKQKTFAIFLTHKSHMRIYFFINRLKFSSFSKKLFNDECLRSPSSFKHFFKEFHTAGCLHN